MPADIFNKHEDLIAVRQGGAVDPAGLFKQLGLTLQRPHQIINLAAFQAQFTDYRFAAQRVKGMIKSGSLAAAGGHGALAVEAPGQI